MTEEEINYWLEVFSKDNQAFMSKDGLIMPLFKVFEQLKEFQHENRQLKQELKLVEKISEFNMPDNMDYVLLCKPNYERNKYEYETLDKYKSILDEIREYIDGVLTIWKTNPSAIATLDLDYLLQQIDKVKE